MLDDAANTDDGCLHAYEIHAMQLRQKWLC